MSAIEIIDWRNEPDRIIDILGPRIVLPTNMEALTRSQLEELDRVHRQPSSSRDPEQWLQDFIKTSAQAVQFAIEVARFDHAKAPEKRPTAIRIGMDRNNAVPGHPVIALEPYLLISGAGRFMGQVTKFEGWDPAEYKYSRPFGYLYARSNQHIGTAPRNLPGMLDLAQIADAIDDISAAAKNSLNGEYDPTNGMLVAYKHPKRGVITLDTDYSLSRLSTGRAYGAWNPDGGPFL